MGLNIHKAEFVRSAAKAGTSQGMGCPRWPLPARSNVGKSSVINRLLGRKNFARVGAAPGKTTHINYFLIDGKFYLVDLPGYGYAKVSQAEKERWARLMESWFADTHPDDPGDYDCGRPPQAHGGRLRHGPVVP